MPSAFHHCIQSNLDSTSSGSVLSNFFSQKNSQKEFFILLFDLSRSARVLNLVLNAVRRFENAVTKANGRVPMVFFRAKTLMTVMTVMVRVIKISNNNYNNNDNNINNDNINDSNNNKKQADHVRNRDLKLVVANAPPNANHFK